MNTGVYLKFILILVITIINHNWSFKYSTLFNEYKDVT